MTPIVREDLFDIR